MTSSEGGIRCSRTETRGLGSKTEEKTTEITETVYGFSAEMLNGPAVSLSDFKGKVLLIVNTASQCGFTPAVRGAGVTLRTYKQRGFEVLGFPCNQFGAQEPGTAAEIGAFCEKNYGVSFPMFAKIDVNGEKAHPLYRFLKSEKPGLLGPLGGGAIKWNFTKFLVDRSGKVVARFASATKPESTGERY